MPEVGGDGWRRSTGLELLWASPSLTASQRRNLFLRRDETSHGYDYFASSGPEEYGRQENAYVLLCSH